jgi:hypothetical protein
MARFVVHPVRDQWCVSYENILLMDFSSREIAEQAALNLARGAVMRGETVSVETRLEIEDGQSRSGNGRDHSQDTPALSS